MRMSTVFTIASVLFVLVAFLFIGCSDDDEADPENGEPPDGQLPGNIPNGATNFQFVTNGLVSYWSFDSSYIKGNIAQDIWGGNDGMIMGGPGLVSGKVGEALDFDGTDDYVDCGGNSSLNITGSITVEFWMNPRNGDKNKHVVSRGQWGAGGYWVQHGGPLGGEQNMIYFYAQQVYQGAIGPTDSTDVNTWQHIAVTYDGASVKLYKNAGLVKSEVAQGPIKPKETSFMISRYAGGNANYFDGMLDEIRVYNRALTAAEVQQNYLAQGMISSDNADSQQQENEQQGNQEQGGGDGIVVTIGQGARPTVSVTHPVTMLTITSHQDGSIWGFMVMGQQNPGVPGPFQYGTTPPGTLAVGGANPPDLVPGQKYAVSATGVMNGQPIAAMFDFVR